MGEDGANKVKLTPSEPHNPFLQDHKGVRHPGLTNSDEWGECQYLTHD